MSYVLDIMFRCQEPGDTLFTAERYDGVRCAIYVRLVGQCRAMTKKGWLA
jgi:hypothetical protein